LPSVIVECLCVGAFANSATDADLDTVALCAALDEMVPHRLAADALRLLSLRYLHGLSARQIAVHLGRPLSNVTKQLAKLRTDLTAQCLGTGDLHRAQESAFAWQHWNSALDETSLSNIDAEALQSALTSGRSNVSPVLALAVVHDYLGRQLSAVRLLNELSAHQDKTYVTAVEQSLKDIELLARPLAGGPTRSGYRSGPVKIAAAVGLAAGLLISVGLGVWSQPEGADDVPRSPPVVEAEVPRPPAPEPAARRAPVVAVISETLDLTDVEGARLGVGTLLREDETVALTQGIVQLSTTSGATLVLQGPVDLRAAQANAFWLGSGKIAGLNAKADVPLVIRTPSSRVVDLGTEFGVSVENDATTRVVVYDGLVELASLDSPSDEGVRLSQGWESRLNRGDAAPKRPHLLTHQREFIRADEVQLRKDANAGVAAAQATVDFYQLMRIEGLLAYQGFDVESACRNLTFGFKDPPVRPPQSVHVVNYASSSSTIRSGSGAIQVQGDGSFHLDLDTSESSRFAAADLLDQDGLLGGKPCEIWIAWRTKIANGTAADFAWAGLSLMNGDARRDDEPLFVGMPSQGTQCGIHLHPRTGRPQEERLYFDGDAEVAGTQPLIPGNEELTWALRVRSDGSASQVSGWCGASIRDFDVGRPQLSCQIERLSFDRFRLETTPQRGDGAWLYDDVTVALTYEAIAEVFAPRREATSPPHHQ
ncbi:MAG: FecR domain-containing protein, partial [Planctomycetales bacterium]|nr:FecR domain-containing protein [Planctomycetales bacterium]